MGSAEDLRELLLDPEEAAVMDAPGSTDAAVLIPLFEHGDRLHAVFTKRRDDLPKHAGEISFPGGTRDFPEEGLLETALREANEEIGLPGDDVRLVGALPPTGTFVTGYKIHPFVGLIEQGREWKLQPSEVEVVLELALPDLMRGFAMKRLLRRGIPIKTPTYTVGNSFVWGATARIVRDLLRRLAPVL